MKSRINPRIAIKPKIVGYCIDDNKKDALMTVAQELNTDINFINKEFAGEKVGYLAEINGFQKTGNKLENPPECEVLLISGLKSTVIDKLLKILRNRNISIDLKCTVTPINQNWELHFLIKELQKEHEAMHKNSI